MSGQIITFVDQPVFFGFGATAPEPERGRWYVFCDGYLSDPNDIRAFLLRTDGTWALRGSLFESKEAARAAVAVAPNQFSTAGREGQQENCP